MQIVWVEVSFHQSDFQMEKSAVERFFHQVIKDEMFSICWSREIFGLKFEESGKVPLLRRELEKTSANLEKLKSEKDT